MRIFHRYKLGDELLQAFNFTSITKFNLAHWMFAFSYLVLSYRLELLAKGLPEDNYNCRFKTFNILVCLFNMGIPAVVWVYSVGERVKGCKHRL